MLGARGDEDAFRVRGGDARLNRNAAQTMSSQESNRGFRPAQLLVLRRQVPVIVLCALLLAGAAFALSVQQSTQYTATALLVFDDNELDQQAAGLAVGSSGAPRAQQTTNVKLLELGEIASQTAALVGLTEQQVKESIRVSAQGESNVVAVDATTTSPTLAAEIASVYADQFISEQQRASRQYFSSVLGAVVKQLASLSPAQRAGPEGLALQNRSQSLKILATAPSGNVRLAQAASIPGSGSYPELVRNTIGGAALGLLLGCCLAFLRQRRKRRINKLDELARIFRLPLLGVVPHSRTYSRHASRDGRKGPAQLPLGDAEVFRTLNTRLRYFNVDHERRVVLVTSAGRDDGKTLVVQNLAEAAASMGSCVLVIDCDLRHPSLAARLGLRQVPGVAEVLISASTIVDAIQGVMVVAADNGSTPTRSTINVLTAGAPPPNPSQLISSQAMDRVLEWAAENYDLVLLDTPPMSVASDVPLLLDRVDGVLIVSRRRNTTRSEATRMHAQLARLQAPTFAVVANGFKPKTKPRYSYYGL